MSGQVPGKVAGQGRWARPGKVRGKNKVGARLGQARLPVA